MTNEPIVTTDNANKDMKRDLTYEHDMLKKNCIAKYARSTRISNPESHRGTDDRWAMAKRAILIYGHHRYTALVEGCASGLAFGVWHKSHRFTEIFMNRTV